MDESTIKHICHLLNKQNFDKRAFLGYSPDFISFASAALLPLAAYITYKRLTHEKSKSEQKIDVAKRTMARLLQQQLNS